MKTIHINLKVKELDKSINFYNELFGAQATTVKPDYAKWQLDDPKVNFSISQSNDKEGLNHLGIQANSSDELHEVYDNIERSKGKVMEEGHTVCCYSQSEKSWVEDPQGILWEAFHTYGTSEVNKTEAVAEAESSCCTPDCCAS
ncbi:MAG: ArsI/CadI family heavy metal resistance metalloenzyme [Bacteroidota bacterium]